MRKWLLPLIAGTVLLAIPAHAEDVYKWKPDPDKRFDRQDINHDGIITKEEFMHPQTTNFARIDADGNNFISMQEMRQYMKEKKPKHLDMKQWEIKADHHFNRKDLNKDNVVSKEEFMSRYETSFKGYDRNMDNQISKEEMHLYWEAEQNLLEKSKTDND